MENPANSDQRIFEIHTNVDSHPGYFVVVSYEIKDGPEEEPHSKETTLTTTLEQARSLVPSHFLRLGHLLGDDPSVLETWV